MDANSYIYTFHLSLINNQLLKNPSFLVWLIDNMPTSYNLRLLSNETYCLGDFTYSSGNI